MIDFVKKEGKIRLEMNLAAARQANLEMSSKLLAVADAGKGKANSCLCDFSKTHPSGANRHWLSC